MSLSNLVNPTFENAPTFVAATTASNWIDGTAAGSASNGSFGWYLGVRATAVAAQFDTTVSHSGTNSLKVSTTNTTGRARVFSAPASGGNISVADSTFLIPVTPSSTYTLTGWANTSTVATNSVFIEIDELNSTFVVGTSTPSATLSGTNGWTQLTASVTVASTTVWLVVAMQNSIAGNVSTAWFDDLLLTGPGLGGTAPTGTLNLLGVG